MLKSLIRNSLIKLLSLAVSLKVWLIVGATWLLLNKHIPAEVWERVVLGVAVGRVIVQSIVAHRTRSRSIDLPKIPEDVRVD